VTDFVTSSIDAFEGAIIIGKIWVSSNPCKYYHAITWITHLPTPEEWKVELA